MTVNGSVDLYHNNVKKFETNANGITVDGGIYPETDNSTDLGSNAGRWKDLYISNDIDILDSGKLLLGTSDDLQCFHDGSDSYINNFTGNFYIRGNGTNNIRIQAKSAEDSIYVKPDQGVELYYDNSKKFHTNSSGVYVTGKLKVADYDSGTHLLSCGTNDDLTLFHDGTHSNIVNATGDLKLDTDNLKIRDKDGGDVHLKCLHDAGVQLYYDNTKKFETTAAGCKVSTGVLDFDDSVEARFGTGNDLKIYHDGSNSIISEVGTGDLYIDAASEYHADDKKVVFGSGADLQIYHNGSHSFVHQDGTGSLYVLADTYRVNNEANSENMISADANGAVNLYYDGTKQFETHTKGIKVSNNEREANIELTNDALTWKIVNYDYGNDGTDHLGFHDGTSDRLIIHDTGEGISFNGDTASANALGDYEEGTFNSHLLATDLTLTSNEYVCYYTKIGRVVIINGYAQGTTPANISAYSANSAHSLAVGNLPFNIINATGARGAAIIGVNSGFSISNDHYISTHGTSNSNSFSIWQEPDTSGTRIGPVITASTAMTLHFSFTYQTT